MYAIIGIITLIIGLLFLLPEILKRLHCTQKGEARICAVIEQVDFENGRSRSKVYHPVYEYEVNGEKLQKHYKQYNKSSSWFQIDSKEKIRYNAKNPNEFVVVNAIGNLVFGSLISLGGVGLIVLHFIR